MSRIVRLKPCAPMGGITCAASPIGPRVPGSGDQPQAPRAARRIVAHRPRTGRGGSGIGARSRARRPRRPGRRGGRHARRDHADEAGPLAGEGDQRHRAPLGVELGRSIAVGTCVAQVQGHGDLRIAPRPRRYAGSLAGGRVAAVCCDHEACRQKGLVRKGESDVLTLVADLADGRGIAADARHARQPFLDRPREVSIGDVPAEGREPDGAGVEGDGRRPARGATSRRRSTWSEAQPRKAAPPAKRRPPRAGGHYHRAAPWFACRQQTGLGQEARRRGHSPQEAPRRRAPRGPRRR